MISRAALAYTLALAVVAPTSAASLTLLPEWFSDQGIRKLWLMPDGQTFTGVDGDDVFRWSSASGRTNIGSLPSTVSSLPAHATAVSDDGNTIIGLLGEDQAKPGGGFMWTVAGGAVVMPPPPDRPNARAIPTALSRDGSVIVGNEYRAIDPWGFQFEWKGALRWTADTGNVPLEGLAYAAAISADGSVVVGGRGSFDEGSAQTVRWTQATGSVVVGVPPIGWLPFTGAEFVSADGATIVGYGYPPDARAGPKIFRWTKAEGMQPLSMLGNSQMAQAISADANVIVGSMRTYVPDAPPPTYAFDSFVWTPDAGLQTLSELLPPLPLDDVDSPNDVWTIRDIYGISADGRIAFGATVRWDFRDNPYVPVIESEYWLLDLSPVPEPSTLTIAVLGLLPMVLSCRRRKSSIQATSRV